MRFLLIIVFIHNDKDSHTFGDQNEQHTAEESEQGEKLRQVLERKMIVENMFVEPDKIEDDADHKNNDVKPPE
jgi:hypothetical protein